MFTQDKVMTQFRLTQDKSSDYKRLFGIQKLCSKREKSAALPASISMTNIRLSPETGLRT